MLNKIISTLQKLDEVKFNAIYAEEVLTDATEMYNAGWDMLEDGAVVLAKGNLVAIKKGNTIVKLDMKDFNINKGVLVGNIRKEIGTIEVTEDKKEEYLAQAIITKNYTIKRA